MNPNRLEAQVQSSGELDTIGASPETKQRRITKSEMDEVGAPNIIQYHYRMLWRLDEILINNAGRRAAHDDSARNGCDIVLGHTLKDGYPATKVAELRRDAQIVGGEPVHLFRIKYRLDYSQQPGLYKVIGREEFLPRRIIEGSPSEAEMDRLAGELRDTVMMLMEAVRDADLNPELAKSYRHEQGSSEA